MGGVTRWLAARPSILSILFLRFVYFSPLYHPRRITLRLSILFLRFSHNAGTTCVAASLLKLSILFLRFLLKPPALFSMRFLIFTFNPLLEIPYIVDPVKQELVSVITLSILFLRFY